MLIKNANKMVLDLINLHGLSNWVLSWNNKRRAFGTCRGRLKIISLSKNLVGLNNKTMVRLVILHEIAHALTPYQHHNSIWRRKLIEIGGDGKRCYDSKKVIMPKGKYVLHCEKCGSERSFFKRLKTRRSCPYCSPTKKFEEKYLLKEKI